MRSYILTDNDRKRLLKWLLEDEEDQQTRNLFAQIRRDLFYISQDIELLTLVVRKLQARGRWDRRISSKDELGRVLKRATEMVKSLKQP
jgi:hypothetical protein